MTMGMTAISIFPIIIIGIALFAFAAYFIIYILSINKKMKNDTMHDAFPSSEESGRKRLRMPGASSAGFTILVISTVVCIVVCFIQLNSLKNELHNMSSNYNLQIMEFQNQLDDSYARLEEMLKEKDSLISSYDIKYKGYDSKTRKGLVTVTVRPKTIAPDTEMTLIYLDEEFVGKRKGNSFIFECNIDILKQVDSEECHAYITLTSCGQTSNEKMPDLSYSFGYWHFLPQIYQCYVYPELTGGRFFFSFDDGFDFDLNFETDVTFSEAEIIFEKNDEIFKSMNVSSDFKNTQSSTEIKIPLPSTKDFPLFSEGDSIKIYLVAKDSAGVTHTCIMTLARVENGQFLPTEISDLNEVLSF